MAVLILAIGSAIQFLWNLLKKTPLCPMRSIDLNSDKRHLVPVLRTIPTCLLFGGSTGLLTLFFVESWSDKGKSAIRVCESGGVCGSFCFQSGPYYAGEQFLLLVVLTSVNLQ